MANQVVVAKIKPQLKISYKAALDDSQDMVNTDFSKLHLIYSNLINNAIKFTTSGEVEFGYTVNSSMIECYVKDTGKGISQDKAEDLMYRFMHTNHLLQEVNEGIGLGLYLASRLTKALGGKLWIDYTSGLGTKFVFTIPYAN